MSLKSMRMSLRSMRMSLKSIRKGLRSMRKSRSRGCGREVSDLDESSGTMNVSDVVLRIAPPAAGVRAFVAFVGNGARVHGVDVSSQGGEGIHFLPTKIARRLRSGRLCFDGVDCL